jgi:hypothetical protein
MNQFLSGASKKGGQRRKLEPMVDNAEEKDGGFPAIDGCLMIFDGTTAYNSQALLDAHVPRGLHS